MGTCNTTKLALTEALIAAWTDFKLPEDSAPSPGGETAKQSSQVLSTDGLGACNETGSFLRLRDCAGDEALLPLASGFHSCMSTKEHLRSSAYSSTTGEVSLAPSAVHSFTWLLLLINLVEGMDRDTARLIRRDANVENRSFLSALKSFAATTRALSPAWQTAEKSPPLLHAP